MYFLQVGTRHAALVVTTHSQRKTPTQHATTQREKQSAVLSCEADAGRAAEDSPDAQETLQV